MDNSVLYDWIFRDNPLTGKVQAVHRDHYNELWNGDKGHILESRSYTTLRELIVKTGGDKDEIEALCDKFHKVNKNLQVFHP